MFEIYFEGKLVTSESSALEVSLFMTAENGLRTGVLGAPVNERVKRPSYAIRYVSERRLNTKLGKTDVFECCVIMWSIFCNIIHHFTLLICII